MRLDRVLNGSQPQAQAALIAPLDNLLWDRRFVQALFDFSYVWEVYKPAAERIYGYYVLPVLYGDRFVARFEPQRDEQSGDLVVKGWWWEPGVTPSAPMRRALRDCFRGFLRYLGADALRFDHEAAKEADLTWLHPLA